MAAAAVCQCRALADKAAMCDSSSALRMDGGVKPAVRGGSWPAGRLLRLGDAWPAVSRVWVELHTGLPLLMQRTASWCAVPYLPAAACSTRCCSAARDQDSPALHAPAHHPAV